MIDRPTGWTRSELVIKRSRFISEAGPILSRESAEGRIATVRSQHPDASHVVYAFVFGSERSLQYAMSDDGEPKNTAGRPVLEVLKGSNLSDCIVTVVRYFGGTKLGTGGLVHAYGESAKRALSDVPREARIDRVLGTLDTTYDSLHSVQHVIESFDARIVSEHFATRVSFTVQVPEANVVAFAQAVRDATRGATEFRVSEDAT